MAVRIGIMIEELILVLGFSVATFDEELLFKLAKLESVPVEIFMADYFSIVELVAISQHSRLSSSHPPDRRRSGSCSSRSY